MKKIIIYTRLEGDTGGDHTRLNIIRDALQLEKTYGLEYQANLFIAHDELSTNRANIVARQWQEKFRGHSEVICNLVNSRVSAISKCMPANHKELQKWIEKGVDLLMFAGWCHQQSKKSAQHLAKIKGQGLNISKETEIFVCATPEQQIDKQNFRTELVNLGYKVYSLQMGLKEAGGYPLSNSATLEIIAEIDTRNEWEAHLAQAVLLSNDGNDELRELKYEQDTNEKDKLIVIYCSKDHPSTETDTFLQQIKMDNNEHYPVILIGLNESNHQTWSNLLSQLGFENVYTVERTPNSAMLMRGLKDAQYSMATGSFSILEAKKLEIDHCQYLCPDHQKDFWKILSNATLAELKQAFDNGEQALLELADFHQNQLDHHHEFQCIEVFHPTIKQESLTESNKSKSQSNQRTHIEKFCFINKKPKVWTSKQESIEEPKIEQQLKQSESNNESDEEYYNSSLFNS